MVGGGLTRVAVRALALLAVVVAGLAAPTAAGRPAAKPRLTLSVKPAAITYGDEITISGVIASKRAGQRVSILAHACGFTAPVEIARVKTKRGGVFAYEVEPLINTRFSARWGKRTSVRRAVRVKPDLRLKKLGAGQYRAEVRTTNGQFLDGRTVILQQKSGQGWGEVARGTLERASSEFALTLISALTFEATVPAGAELRFFLPQSQAGCYQAATSGAIAG